MNKISKSAVTDLELVEAIKSENKEESEKAFTILFKKYHKTMLTRFGGLISDEVTAESLVLESFVKVSTNLEKFNQDAAVFSTWFFKLTQNLFIDYLRRKKEEAISLSEMAKRDEDNDTVEYDIPCHDMSPERRMIVDERNKKIDEILNSMKNQEIATAVRMRFFDGCSYEEISVATGRPLGTIKAFLFRAKILLKKEFEKNHISL